MNKFNAILSCLLLTGFAATSTAEAAMTRPGQQRRERTGVRAPKMVSPVMRNIKGGTNADKPLYGMLFEAYDGDFMGWQGPMEISASGSHTQLTDDAIETSSGCYFDGKFLNVGLDGESAVWTLFDASTWTPVSSTVTYTPNSEYTLPVSMTYDPASATIYGIMFQSAANMWEDPASVFVSIDPTNYAEPVKVINDTGVKIRAIAADVDGTIYALGSDAVIYTINKFNAELTKVTDYQLEAFEGDPFGDTWYIGHESAVIDWATGDLYFSYADSESDTFIAKINKQTGESEIVGNYGYWSEGTECCEIFCALWFDQSAGGSVAGVPAAAAEFSGVANGAALNATVSFTMPSVDTEGGALSGSLDWTITDGTSKLASGSAAPGQKVEAVVNVPEAGIYNLVLTVSAGSNEGKPVTFRLFVGPDTPVITGLPSAMVDESGMSVLVRWQAAVSVNGGNLADPVTYKVVRMPDAVTVAEAVTDVKFLDHITSDIKTTYTYEITPTAGSVTGQAVTSRAAAAGIYFSVPHIYSFTKRANEDIFNQYPTIDVDNDANDWFMNSSYGVACPGAENGMDDYLLVGPFKLEAGALYTFAFSADGHSQIEHVAAYVGTDADDVTTFTGNCIVPETEVNPRVGAKKLSGDFIPTESGCHYFAIHACTPHVSQFLYIGDVSVTVAGKSAPAAATEFTITPEADGLKLAFIVPSKTLDQGAAQVSSVNIYRDGSILTSITDGVADGAKLTYKDDTADNGNHLYVVKAVNGEGEGAPASLTAWAGLDIPGFVPNLRVVEDVNTQGLIHLTWDAPKAGVNGGYIDPAGLTYKLDWLSFDVPEGSGLVEMGSGNSFDLQLNGVTKQGLFAASVYAANAKGEDRTTWNTKVCYFGPAYELPLRESWANMGQKSGSWSGQDLVDKTGLFESFWDIIDGQITGFAPQDADGGMLALSTTISGGGKRVTSPRFALGDAKEPVLVFYYRATADVEEFRVEALVDDKLPQTIKTLTPLSAADFGKWQRVEISLKQFASCKYMQVGFTGTAKTPAQEFVAIDNVSIFDYIGNDLMVTAFDAPSKVDVNTEATFTLSIRNGGGNKVNAADYNVLLIKNGEVAGTFPGKDIAGDASLTMTLTDVPTVADYESSEYYAEIDFAADQNTENNRSAVKFVRIITPRYPTVTGLKAELNSGVLLTWQDPASENMPYASVTETWDTYAPFIIDGIGDWTVYDGDQCNTVRLATPGLGVLDYPNIGGKIAWQVMDPGAANIISNPWYARSGQQFLVSFQACNENGERSAQSNDWLISPALSGNAQTISFYATTGMSSYSPEVIDVLYSTGGTDIDEFQLLEGDVNITYDANWTEYFFNIPAGARHFAIVHKTANQVALLIDDLTYEPAGAPQLTLQLQGFNVYRDGVRLNSEPVTDNEYLDSDADLSDGRKVDYNVTAVWDKGESPMSETVTVSTASLSGITATVTVSAVPGAVKVATDAPVAVAVYTASGVRVAALTVGSVTEIAVPAPGVYLVNAGGKMVKLLVK